jgi:hypothetical protein
MTEPRDEVLRYCEHGPPRGTRTRTAPRRTCTHQPADVTKCSCLVVFCTCDGDRHALRWPCPTVLSLASIYGEEP